MQQTSHKFVDSKVKILFFLFLIIVALFAQFHISNTLDARFFYSQKEALDYLQGLSFEDSLLYWKTETTDFFFISVYTAFLYLSFKRLLPRNPKLKYLVFLPTFFDVIETATIWSYLAFQVDIGLSSWLGYFTLMKWLSLLLIILIFIKMRLQKY